MCEYCDKHDGNKAITDNGCCRAEVCFDGLDDWVLRVTARQEDRWYGDEVEKDEINYCPMRGRDLRGGA